MDNILNILSSFNSAHEEALMHGFYNALALGILCLVTAASYCLYIILSPFVKPLIWALLCGAVLFPFKLSLSTCVQTWFSNMEKSNKPILMNLLITPFHLTDQFAEFLGNFIWKCRQKYWQLVGLPLSLILICCLVYSYSPTILSQLVCQIFSLVYILTAFFISSCNFYIVSTVVICYILVIIFYWRPEHSLHFHLACASVWMVISLYISNFFGTYAVATFYFLNSLLLMGFIHELALILDHCESNQSSFTNMLRAILHSTDPPAAQENVQLTQSNVNQDIEEPASLSRQSSTESEKTVKPKPKLLKSVTFGENADKWFPKRYSSSDYVGPNRLPFLSDRNFLKKIRLEFRQTLELEDDKVCTSNYIYGMLYLCIGMVLWKHKWLVPILMVPIGYYLVKLAGSYFGVWDKVYEYYKRAKGSIGDWCSVRGQALVPINVQGLYKIAIIVNQKVTAILKSSIDTVSTIAVIVGLLVFTSLTSMFLTFQVYGEGLHLLQVAGQLLNTTVMNNPDIDWIPQSWEDSINNVLDDAYTHGRDFISKGLKGFTKDFDPAKADHLEKKVLELWDRLYQAWMMSSDNPTFIGPVVNPDAAYSVWENLKENLLKIPSNFFDVSAIKIFVQENIGIVTSILDSMWSIVKGNASVIFSLFTDSLYVVIMSGSLLVNFVISMVVFFSTLFYLLSSSGKTYKPIEMVTVYSPISCHRFAIALQEVVIAVFTVTFKLASFFGMWTWFVHNLFQVKVAYLPAVFAALLGAVPFLDPYFACLPATVELWFTRGPMTALVFFIFHFLASNIIVTDFYKEIKGGGHPYLTGLSIAGGVFCLGVEGAIFGPLLLCCIIVAINLGRRTFFSPTTEETLNSLKSQLNQLKK